MCAVAIVEGLEAVEVEHRDRERRSLAARAGQLARQLLVERPPVRQAGELVGADHALEAVDVGRPADRELRLSGEQLQHRARAPRDHRDAIPPCDGEDSGMDERPPDRVPRGGAGARAPQQVALGAGGAVRPGDDLVALADRPRGARHGVADPDLGAAYVGSDDLGHDEDEPALGGLQKHRDGSVGDLRRALADDAARVVGAARTGKGARHVRDERDNPLPTAPARADRASARPSVHSIGMPRGTG